MILARPFPVLAPALVAGLAAAAVAMAATTTQAEREALDSLNDREAALSTEQGRNLNTLARLLSVLEQLKRDPPPALLVSPADARDAVRATILVKAMTPELRRRARGYAAEAMEIARQRRLAAVASEALFTAESDDAERLTDPGDSATAGLDPLRGYAGPGRLTADDTPMTAPARLLPPTSGRVIQPFGATLMGGGHANGLTIAAPKGAKVLAPGDGVVQYVGPVKGWGVILILRLAGGYHLVLGGLDRTSVAVGQSVAEGAAVGMMPDGRQSSSDLYLEVREQGASVDPARWLGKTATRSG